MVLYAGEARFNAARAARLAGYRGNPVALAVAGNRLLANPRVKAAIDARLKARAITSDTILAELTDIALGGLADLLEYGPDGKPRINWATFRESGRTGALKRLVRRSGGVDIEFHDRVRALELLGKALKMWDPAQPPDDVSNNPMILAFRAIAGVPPRDAQEEEYRRNAEAERRRQEELRWEQDRAFAERFGLEEHNTYRKPQQTPAPAGGDDDGRDA